MPNTKANSCAKKLFGSTDPTFIVMQLLEIVQSVIAEQTLSPSAEAQIQQLLWSQTLAGEDLEALNQLVEVLLNGTVKCSQSLQLPSMEMPQ